MRPSIAIPPVCGTPTTSTSSSGFASSKQAQWGNQALGDVPVLGDIDGDRKADPIVWRASTGTWYWLTSSSGYSYAASGIKQWGNLAAGDVPVPGDLDGDGRVDLVVWRASTGTWFWLPSSAGFDLGSQRNRQWGTPGDTPILTDMDGDGRGDLTIWRPSTGTWYWLTSTTGYSYPSAGGQQWGNAALGDVPVR